MQYILKTNGSWFLVSEGKVLCMIHPTTLPTPHSFSFFHSLFATFYQVHSRLIGLLIVGCNLCVVFNSWAKTQETWGDAASSFMLVWCVRASRHEGPLTRPPYLMCWEWEQAGLLVDICRRKNYLQVKFYSCSSDKLFPSRIWYLEVSDELSGKGSITKNRSRRL